MGLVVADDGWRIPDKVWVQMEPAVAGAAGASARLPQPARARPGCDERDPARAAHGDAVERARRVREWTDAGVVLEFWRHGLLAYDAKHGIEWEWPAMDGALGKAPLGGELTGPNPTDRAKKGRNDRSSPRARAFPSGSRRRART